MLSSSMSVSLRLSCWSTQPSKLVSVLSWMSLESAKVSYKPGYGHEYWIVDDGIRRCWMMVRFVLVLFSMPLDSQDVE